MDLKVVKKSREMVRPSWNVQAADQALYKIHPWNQIQDLHILLLTDQDLHRQEV